MTTETEAKNLIVLNEGQARYLTDLSRAADGYRGSWESLSDRATKELACLDAGQWVNGPNHQVMAEVQQEYGKIKMALDLVWSVFRVDIFTEHEDRAAARKEIDGFLTIALGKGQGFHGTFFQANKTLADYKK